MIEPTSNLKDKKTCGVPVNCEVSNFEDDKKNALKMCGRLSIRDSAQKVEAIQKENKSSKYGGSSCPTLKSEELNCPYYEETQPTCPDDCGTNPDMYTTLNCIKGDGLCPASRPRNINPRKVFCKNDDCLENDKCDDSEDCYGDMICLKKMEVILMELVIFQNGI